MARMVRRMRQQADQGYSASALSALGTLNRRGATTLGELAEAEGVSRPSITVLAAALERDGLIAREPDPGDRRVVRVSLTREGRQALQRSRSRRDAFLAQRLRGVPEDELETLARAASILERLIEEGR